MASVNDHESKINKILEHHTITVSANLASKTKLCTISLPTPSSAIIEISCTSGYNALYSQANSWATLYLRSSNNTSTYNSDCSISVVCTKNNNTEVYYVPLGNSKFDIYLHCEQYAQESLITVKHSSEFSWILEKVESIPTTATQNEVIKTILWKQGDAITGAVWNDYAEKFEKPADLQTEPGDIISLDNNGNEEIYKLATEGDTNIVGVHSDEYGMLLGGTENEEYDKQHYIPVGMLGRVKTKIIGSINKGERIVPSNIPGIGRAYKDGDSLFSIVGYATETNLNTDIKKVRIKINTH